MKITPNKNINNPKNRSEIKKQQISEAASLPAFVPGLQDHGTFEITAERHEQLHVIPTESYEHRDFVEARRNFRMVFQPQAWLGIFPGGHIIQEVKSYIVYTG